MKKAIAILLVLLVAGVMFGAYTPAEIPDPAASSLDITASNDGVLQYKLHQATDTAVTNNTTWTAASAIPETGVPVAFNLTSDQSIARYSIRTNTKKTVSVSVVAAPMTTKTGEVVDYYIPYTLTIGSDTSNFSNATAGTTVIASATLPLTITRPATGMDYISSLVQIKFAEDYTLSALEGDYSATLTFTIAAK